MNNNSSVIIEIRAGAGGEEAALFAKDLFKMYSKYGASQGWQQKILDSSISEMAGFKQLVFSFKDGQVLSKMKYEGGVHRVQRIPKTEKANRIHTSTVSVAVLPQPQKTQVKISPQDIKMETFKASGPGGQYVNKRQTAVRIIHLPTRISVASQTSRNLAENKKAALEILSAKLFAQEQGKIETARDQERKSQIGRAQRAEKIRTYNFPQDRVTDHRIKKTWHNLEKIMAGNLEPIISKLQKVF